MNTSNGFERFNFYLAQLDILFSKAANEKNPALWLYTNDARTPLFMLEGLAKLYAGMHDRKMFNKIKERFKLLEDALGEIDYYDAFGKSFSAKPNIPPVVISYLHAQSREKTESLNNILIKGKWIGESANRVKKIRKKIATAQWKEPKEELKALFDFYRKAITDIKELMSSTGNQFTEIEGQLHEMRRRLRWLSIYPQALQGVIQLNESRKTNPVLDKYLVPEIVTSSFNKMPAPRNNSYFLLFEKNYFLALSWLIAELGKLKDNGLSILATAEAYQQTAELGHEAALDEAFSILGEDASALNNILAEGTAICKTFFDEKILDKLIHGITSLKNLKL